MSPEQNAEARAVLTDVISMLIALLDMLDGDPDFEDDGISEVETDQDDAPITLNRDKAA